MKKIYLLILLINLLLGCNYASNIKKKPGKITHPVFSSNVISKEKLEGRWGELRDTAAAFSINKNDIFYYDATEFRRYSLSNNTIKVMFAAYSYEARLKMKGNDTLIMIGLGKFKDEIDTLHRCN